MSRSMYAFDAHNADQLQSKANQYKVLPPSGVEFSRSRPQNVIICFGDVIHWW